MSQAALEVVRRLDASRTALDAVLVDLAESDLDRRLAPGSWTVRQQLDHIERSERAFLILVRLIRVKDVPRRLLRMRDEPGPPTLDFTYAGTSIPTPWLVRPHGHRPHATLLARLERTRRKTLGTLRRLAQSPGRGSTWPHPAFGRLDAIQWLAVAALHEAHHVEQLRAILTASRG